MNGTRALEIRLVSSLHVDEMLPGSPACAIRPTLIKLCN
jgi:hypothetical protein